MQSIVTKQLTILGLPNDVISCIALLNPEVFLHLARTHRKFARILRQPAIQALAKSAFSRQHTFVQSLHSCYTVVADLLPNGKPHGHVRLYNKNNDPVTIAQFVDGHRHGIERRYSNGELRYETNYHKGNKRGSEKTYNADGEVVDHIVWNDNDTMKSRIFNCTGDTQIKERYVNGHLRERTTTVNGKNHSIERFRKEEPINERERPWAKNNRRRVTEREPLRVKGDLTTYKPYYLHPPMRNIDRCMNLSDLKLHGKQVTFHSNGMPSTIIDYRDGLMHGKHLTYAEDGTLINSEEYEYGSKRGVLRMVTYTIVIDGETHVSQLLVRNN